MESNHIFLVATAALCWFSTGVSWLLQLVTYPTFKFLSEENSCLFYNSFNGRLLKTVKIPMFLGNILMLILVAFHPETCPMGLIYLTALCSILIIFTTLKYEFPNRKVLEKAGKNKDLMGVLLKNNLTQSIGWTISSLSLAYMILKMI